MKKIFFTILLLTLLLPLTTRATTYEAYFSRPPQNIEESKEFGIDVEIEASGPINAIEMEISYEETKLEFVNSSNAGSIIEIWPEKPKAENGTIYVSGGMTEPFSGGGAQVIHLTFVPLVAGETTLGFRKGSVFQADGKGTEIPLNKNETTISIAPKTQVEEEEVIPGQVEGENDERDQNPPVILLELVKNPKDGKELVSFMALDPESGVAKTEMREKKWLFFSTWRDVANPVPYEPGIWKIELRAINNAGLSHVESLTIGKIFIAKVVLFLALIILVAFMFHVSYNIRKRRV